jgi:hypothetical protein
MQHHRTALVNSPNRFWTNGDLPLNLSVISGADRGDQRCDFGVYWPGRRLGDDICTKLCALIDPGAQTRRSKCGIPQFESQLGGHCRSTLISKPTGGSQLGRFLVISHQDTTAFSFNLRTAAAPQDTSYHKTVQRKLCGFLCILIHVATRFPVLTF